MMVKKIFNLHLIYDKLLSDRTRISVERAILIFALLSFIVHLVVIYLVKFNFINISSSSELLINASFPLWSSSDS